MSTEGAPAQELSQEDKVKFQAMQDLDDILALRKTPAFARYFQRRIREKAEPLAASILKDKLSFEDYREKKAALAAFLELGDLLDNDELGNRSICGRVPPNSA